MALNWKTYNAIPRLGNYFEAKQRYDNTAPIRGDAHETRPCGRRDQKWFSIWMKGSSVCVGYGYGKLEERQALVTYHADGHITITRHGHWYGGASTNERLTRLMGKQFTTHQYDQWVRCTFFDNGVNRKGWLPIPQGDAQFARVGDELVYLNYRYPAVHKLIPHAMKEYRDKVRPVLDYLHNIHKLQGERYVDFTQETKGELFGWYGHPGTTNRWPQVPNLRWGTDAEQNRADFFMWATSGDHADLLKAAVVLANHEYNMSRVARFLDELIIQHHKDAVLEAQVVRTGKLVKDRYRRYFSS